MQYFILGNIQLAYALPYMWQLKNGHIHKTCRRALWEKFGRPSHDA
jgi:hypothetical protein